MFLWQSSRGEDLVILEPLLFKGVFVVVSELHEVIDVSLPLEGHNKGPTIYLLQVDWCQAVKKISYLSHWNCCIKRERD